MPRMDEIKKMNKKEIAKSRSIVLSEITTAPRMKKAINKTVSPQVVDGLKGDPENKKKSIITNPKTKDSVSRKNIFFSSLTSLQNKSEKKNLKHNPKKEYFLQSLRKAIKLFFLFMLIYIFLCITFFLSLYQFQSFAPKLNLLSYVFPVPVFVSDHGMLSLQKYSEIQRQISITENENRRELFIQSLIGRYYSDKYQVFGQSDLNKVSLFDEEINLVPLSRIKKIKAMLDQGDDFVELSQKFGDNVGQLNVDLADSKKYEYFDKLKSLDNEEISNIIYQSDGYYIYKCYNRTNKQLELSYVYVAGRSLEQFIQKEIDTYKYWSIFDLNDAFPN